MSHVIEEPSFSRVTEKWTQPPTTGFCEAAHNISNIFFALYCGKEDAIHITLRSFDFARAVMSCIRSKCWLIDYQLASRCPLVEFWAIIRGFFVSWRQVNS